MRTKEIAAYVRNNVEFFEERLQMALNKMERMREPLRMADQELYDDICAGLNMEYLNCGNGYYYMLINREKFIGIDID